MDLTVCRMHLGYYLMEGTLVVEKLGEFIGKHIGRRKFGESILKTKFVMCSYITRATYVHLLQKSSIIFKTSSMVNASQHAIREYLYTK